MVKTRFEKIIWTSRLWDQKRRYSRFEAWVDICRLLADSRGRVKVSYSELADRWRWPRATVSRFMKERVAEDDLELIHLSKDPTQASSYRIVT